MSKNTIEVKRKCCLSTPPCKKCPIVVLREALREAKAEEAAKARKKAAKQAAGAEKATAAEPGDLGAGRSGR